MPPTIHILCEGEWPSRMTYGEEIRDPLLTQNGIIQARRFRQEFRNFNQVSAMFSSPLRRAIQTAQLAFEPVLNHRGVPITLLQNLQGLRGSPNHTGSPLEQLREQFEYILDIQDLQDGWWDNITNNHITSFLHTNIATAQARQARIQIREAARQLGEDDHILVVSDRRFIAYLTESVSDPPANGEHRSYQFADLWNADSNNTASLVRVGAIQNVVIPLDPDVNWSGTTLVGSQGADPSVAGPSTAGPSVAGPPGPIPGHSPGSDDSPPGLSPAGSGSPSSDSLPELSSPGSGSSPDNVGVFEYEEDDD
ncbi:hypothetical protein F4803DRAFT_571003 [Xylaria telfairii]|nr:hypothetical protein F4803DRAFT_571003 [Xylaria telfairii]